MAKDQQQDFNIFENMDEIAVQLEEALESKHYNEARHILAESNEADAAHAIEELPKELAAVAFRMLPKSMGADVFSYLESDTQEALMEGLTEREVTETVNELFLDDAVDFLEEMPANVVKRVLRYSSPDRRLQINKLLNYPEDSAGSLMTVEMIQLRRSWTVGESLKHIRETGHNKETIYTCYVTNQTAVLEGVVSVHELLCSSDDVRIEDLMDPDVISIETTDDQEYASRLFHHYDFIALPVVDKENRLVGIITIDDALDVITEEATEDMQRMAAMTPNEHPYLRTSVLRLANRRIVWLLVLMISGMLNGAILGQFEDAFVALPLLVTFIPVLTDTGGNAGAQTSTLVIRALTLGEIKPSDALRVLWKEFRVSIICGLILALVTAARVYFMMSPDPLTTLTVSLALFCTVVLAKFVGSLLPILAQILKVDPAIMAAPLITTIVDAVSLIIYFEMAKVLLKI
ncbi:MAG: magnesium transporter [Eubacteriales bacterium]|nr:magnesium transporter [Eubacteriales bacterium]